MGGPALEEGLLFYYTGRYFVLLYILHLLYVLAWKPNIVSASIDACSTGFPRIHALKTIYCGICTVLFCIFILLCCTVLYLYIIYCTLLQDLGNNVL